MNDQIRTLTAPRLSPAEQRAELERALEALREATGALYRAESGDVVVGKEASNAYWAASQAIAHIHHALKELGQ